MARLGPLCRAPRLLLHFLALLCCACAYNVDLGSRLVFTGPNGSYFGYSVLGHSYRDSSWILVGAPKADSDLLTETVHPGAIFKCRVQPNGEQSCTEMLLGSRHNHQCGRTCLEERDNQWLGVSMARQNKPDGKILACAHRWKNAFYVREWKLPHGLCYIIPASLAPSESTHIIPCFKEHQKKYGEEHGSCQAGIAGLFLEDAVVLGAPGSFYWTGTVILHNLTTRANSFYSESERRAVGYSSYLGYSITAGHFTHPQSTEVVGGAPQRANVGEVYLFRIQRGGLHIIRHFSGKKMGSYFGSALCAVDLNSDGLSDLLVGAPTHSASRDEGRVHVYVNHGNGDLVEQEPLVGLNAYNAHFGAVIAALGDIDDDGFPDVAVGAPQEEEFGAVYIYHGSQNGITHKHSQRIFGKSIESGISMFGQSISGQVDLDGNGYPDVVIGAFTSDVAVLFRTRPVITVEASVVLPRSVNITAPLCVDGGQPTLCLNVSVCLRFRGRAVPGKIELFYNLTADVAKKAGGSRIILGPYADGITQVSGKADLAYDKQLCRTQLAYIKRDMRDVISPLAFEVSYWLGKHHVDDVGGTNGRPRFPSLEPILRWNDGRGSVVRNKTVFERNCFNEDCATDMKLEAKMFSKSAIQTEELVIGDGRTVSLNVTVRNEGDDAYDATTTLSFPSSLFFVKVWEPEEKSVNCELKQEEDQPINSLKCSIRFPCMKARTKREFSVVFDTTQLTGSEGPLEFTLQARSASPEHASMLEDNDLVLRVPLRFQVDTTMKGTVNPPSFVYGGEATNSSQFVRLDNADCLYQWINFSLQVINFGPSPLPSSSVEVLIPNVLTEDGPELFHVRHIKINSANGKCFTKVPSQICLVPHDSGSFLRTLFTIFNKSGRKVLDCAWRGGCLVVGCQLGNIDSGNSISINVSTLLNTKILEKDSSSVIQFLVDAKVHLNHSLHIYEAPGGNPDGTTVVFEALHDLRPRGYVAVWIIALSLLIGILIFILLAVVLWKLGFFKRSYKERMQASKQEKESLD
uniref:Integrin alpha-9 n=1 Tax=Petromyzon marinus TaxID=7757 RepID=A0AAJ7TPJ1_PETMA|nr:integrin alpha-9 [Petromyzon marinus]